MEKEKSIVVQPQVQSIERVQEEKPHTKFGEIIQRYEIGGLELTDEQKRILYEEFPDEDIEIRPDGLIYVPWFRYVERLRKAGLKFTFVPEGTPKFIPEENLVLWGFWLVIDGKVCGFAYGEANYIPQNERMTYGDAIEAAKSNAIMRLCKDLGIGGLRIWDPDFVEEWKRKYAITYTDEKGKVRWKKRKIQVTQAPTQETPKEENEETPKAREIFANMVKTHFLDPNDWVMLINRVNRFDTLEANQISDGITWIRQKTQNRTKADLLRNALRWRQHYIDVIAQNPDFYPSIDEFGELPDNSWTIEELKSYIDKIRNTLYKNDLERAIYIIKKGFKDDSREDNSNI